MLSRSHHTGLTTPSCQHLHVLAWRSPLVTRAYCAWATWQGDVLRNKRPQEYPSSSVGLEMRYTCPSPPTLDWDFRTTGFPGRTQPQIPKTLNCLMMDTSIPSPFPHFPTHVYWDHLQNQEFPQAAPWGTQIKIAKALSWKWLKTKKPNITFCLL